MDKAYKTKSLSDGEAYQKPQKMRDVNIGGDVKGITEEPVEGFKKNSGLAKKAMDKMKYAPKTVSYAEFTSTKRNAQLQSMVGPNKDESTKDKMEKLGIEDLPAKKSQKSFDIDVTKYSPRKAKG